MGQMCRLLRSEYPQHSFLSYPKVQGLPFTTEELLARIRHVLTS